jgi:mannose-6-phosphate isomerase
MNQLYPLKFEPIFSEKIWGGDKLKTFLNKNIPSVKTGESWEISGIPGNVSIVGNGFLAGNPLDELIEVYMGDLVGDRIYEQFGPTFPLLIKFIDANDVLSIQVHPDDEMAMERHNSFGKTEMWYIMQAEAGAELIVGFNKEVTKEEYLEKVESNTLKEILNYEPVKAGDVFFLLAGRIHSIGAGILLAEIQQSSDITYRIYDFDRLDDKGNPRELHTDLAVEAIDFTMPKTFRSVYSDKNNMPVELEKCTYFTTRLLQLTKQVERDISMLDSFVIYMCLQGSCKLHYNNTETIEVSLGETILVPASLSVYTIEPIESVKLIEVYIDSPLETEQA